MSMANVNVNKLDLEIKCTKIVVDLQNEPRWIFILCKGKFQTMVTLEPFLNHSNSWILYNSKEPTKAWFIVLSRKNYGKRFSEMRSLPNFGPNPLESHHPHFALINHCAPFCRFFYFRPMSAQNLHIICEIKPLNKIL